MYPLTTENFVCERWNFLGVYDCTFYWQNNDVLLRMRKHIMGMSKQLQARRRRRLFLGQHFSHPLIAFGWFIV